jgi:hypothetical protein
MIDFLNLTAMGETVLNFTELSGIVECLFSGRANARKLSNPYQGFQPLSDGYKFP